jgi:hypothetical protein
LLPPLALARDRLIGSRPLSFHLGLGVSLLRQDAIERLDQPRISLAQGRNGITQGADLNRLSHVRLGARRMRATLRTLGRLRNVGRHPDAHLAIVARLAAQALTLRRAHGCAIRHPPRTR